MGDGQLSFVFLRWLGDEVGSSSPAHIVVTYALIPSSASSMFTVGDAVTYLTTLSGDSLRLVNAERSIDVVFSRVASSSTPDFVKGVWKTNVQSPATYVQFL